MRSSGCRSQQPPLTGRPNNSRKKKNASYVNDACAVPVLNYSTYSSNDTSNGQHEENMSIVKTCNRQKGFRLTSCMSDSSRISGIAIQYRFYCTTGSRLASKPSRVSTMQTRIATNEEEKNWSSTTTIKNMRSLLLLLGRVRNKIDHNDTQMSKTYVRTYRFKTLGRLVLKVAERFCRCSFISCSSYVRVEDQIKSSRPTQNVKGRRWSFREKTLHDEYFQKWLDNKYFQKWRVPEELSRHKYVRDVRPNPLETTNASSQPTKSFRT